MRTRETNPAAGAPRGRGTGLNPGNRFENIHLEVLDEAALAARSGPVATAVLTERTRSIINRVEAPDLPFDWTVNPYRGCEHGCIYCYARPGHEYLGMSCGIDFETRIVAKREAPELLRTALMKPGWKGEGIMLSGVTDPYQPIERELRITRGCLEVCAEFGQPVGVITKNHLVTRDIDLLASLAAKKASRAAVSVTTLDPALAATMEPRASSPRARLEAIRELSRAGIPVTVMFAPVIPRVNDHEMAAVLHAAAEAGATSAGYVLLRLPWQVKTLFLEWLQRHLPDRAAHVEALIRDTRGGELTQGGYGVRHRGTGVIADHLAASYKVFAKQARLNIRREGLSSAAFRRPNRGGQSGLWD